MVRLILEEGGRKRAFNLNDGTLTIGSGESCSLTLVSTDVAENHAELVIRDGEVTLRPRAGVLPPTIQGRPVSKEQGVPLGSTFKIGSATLQLVDPNAPKGAAPAAAPAPPKRARRGHKVVGAPRSDTHGVSAVHRTRPVATIKHGMPSWAIVLLLLLVVGGGGYGVVAYFGNEMSEETDSVEDTLRFAESHLSVNNLKGVEHKLALIKESDLTTQNLRDRYNALKSNLVTIEEGKEQALSDQVGTVYLTNQLKKFESSRLKGNPDPKKVRVFLLRCKEFRENFPDHPDMDWVDRQESRFRGRIDINARATFEEIEYEIETLTWSDPRHFRDAFARLQPYLDGEDAEAARALEAKLRTEQQEQFTEHMLQAKFEWTNEEKGNKGTAAEILRTLVVYYEDPAMIEQAATELIGLPGVKPLMESWKRDKPHLFDEMMENSILRGFAKREGLL